MASKGSSSGCFSPNNLETSESIARIKKKWCLPLEAGFWKGESMVRLRMRRTMEGGKWNILQQVVALPS